MSGLDLYITQRALALMFVYAAVTGFLLGGVYDTLRILRALLGLQGEEAGSTPSLGGRLLLFLEDVLFMLVTSVTFILLCYYTNDGQLRAPAFVGMACGFFVYRYTLGALTRRLTKPLVRFVRFLTRLLLTPIRIPLKWLGRVITKALKGLGRRVSEKRTSRKKTEETPFPSDSAEKLSPDSDAAPV